METEPPIERAARHEALPNELEVLAWRDELVEANGFGPRSMYVEMCWLPVLGPTATWLYRRLGSWAEFNPDGFNLDLTDLSVSLGLGEGLGKNSMLARAFERLTRFDAARWDRRQLQVRTALAPLPQRHVERLSYTTRQLHDDYVRAPRGDNPELLK